MKAIVLAGGKGSKIAPFSKKHQKCCLPVGNEPVLLRLIKQLKKAGLKDITVVTNYLEQDVKNILSDFNDIKLKHVDDLFSLFNKISHNEDLIVCHGDIYASDNDIKRVVDSKCGILLQYANDDFRLNDYICADVKKNKITSFWGHPRGTYANARSCGVYKLSKELLACMSKVPKTFLKVPTGGMPDEEFRIEQLLQAGIENNIKVEPIVALDHIVDIDFPWDIMMANAYYCKDEVATLKKSKIAKNSKISKSADIRGNIILGANSYIGHNVIIEGNCIIGDNVTIDNGAIIEANCVIGNNSFVKDYSKITNETVIGPSNKIGFNAEVCGVTLDGVAAVHGCEIFGVIGTKVDIAAGCTTGILRFDDQLCRKKIKGKWYTNRYANGVFIGDYSRTGVNNIFNPGIFVGVNSAIGAGLVVDKDIPDNTLAIQESKISFKEWGSDKYGW